MTKSTDVVWRKHGDDWILFAGRRRVGRVVPDTKYRGMYRPALSQRRVGDMANLSWAKNAVLVEAEATDQVRNRAKLKKSPQKETQYQGVMTPKIRLSLGSSLVR
jgi:hypothetical protein